MTSPMGSQYLSADELHSLTDAKSAKRQMAWLAAHVVPFRFNGRDVLVLRVVAQEWELTGSRPAAALPDILR